MIGKLLRVEAIKLRSRSAFTIVLLIFFVVLALILGVMVYTAVSKDMKLPMPRFWNDIHSALIQLIVFLGMITIVNLTAAEYGWRTSRQNVIDGLSREEWFTAKMLVWLLIPLMFWFTALAIAGITAGIFGERGGTFITGGQIKAMLALLLSAVGFGSLGLFASFLTRNAAGAVALIFAWMTLGEGLIQAMLGRIGREYIKYAEYLPVQTFGRLGELRRWIGDQISMRGGVVSQPREFLSNEVSLLLAAAYMAIFVGASFFLVRRQDL